MSEQESRRAKADKITKKTAEIPADQVNVSPEVASKINKLDLKQRAQVMEIVQTAIKQESFSGPIPHPDLLQGYENIKEGFAERIVRMAEKEQEHRFEHENSQSACDKMLIEATASDSKRGQNYALIITILFLIGAVTLALYGHDTVASILGGGTLAAIVTVFITGKNGNSKKEQDHN